MTPLELIADTCARNLGMLSHSLADFTDADMLVRPCPGANHTAWQLGHLVVSETQMLNACQAGIIPELPAGFADKFTSKTAAIDDPAAFPAKAQLLAMLGKAREAAVAWIRTLDPRRLNDPGPERMREFMPTVGHVVMMIPQHVAMHLGQAQVVRRKLGKPVMF